jgi:hypothetical protein
MHHALCYTRLISIIYQCICICKQDWWIRRTRKNSHGACTMIIGYVPSASTARTRLSNTELYSIGQPGFSLFYSHRQTDHAGFTEDTGSSWTWAPVLRLCSPSTYYSIPLHHDQHCRTGAVLLCLWQTSDFIAHRTDTRLVSQHLPTPLQLASTHPRYPTRTTLPQSWTNGHLTVGKRKSEYSI